MGQQFGAGFVRCAERGIIGWQRAWLFVALVWAWMSHAFGQGQPDMLWVRAGHAGWVNTVAF